MELYFLLAILCTMFEEEVIDILLDAFHESTDDVK